MRRLFPTCFCLTCELWTGFVFVRRFSQLSSCLSRSGQLSTCTYTFNTGSHHVQDLWSDTSFFFPQWGLRHSEVRSLRQVPQIICRPIRPLLFSGTAMSSRLGICLATAESSGQVSFSPYSRSLVRSSLVPPAGSRNQVSLGFPVTLYYHCLSFRHCRFGVLQWFSPLLGVPDRFLAVPCQSWPHVPTQCRSRDRSQHPSVPEVLCHVTTGSSGQLSVWGTRLDPYSPNTTSSGQAAGSHRMRNDTLSHPSQCSIKALSIVRSFPLGFLCTHRRAA